jgi:hypothetical protein
LEVIGRAYVTFVGITTDWWRCEHSMCSQAKWSLVHGYAMLLLDGRLKQPIAKFPPGANEMAFPPAILSAALPKIRSIRQEASVAAGN